MRLTLSQLLEVLVLDTNDLKNLRRRDQVALAFGLRHAYESQTYLPIDVVAMLLAGTLAKAYPQTMAAQLVRVYADGWARVVAEAEADRTVDVSFSVVDFEAPNGAEAHMVAGSAGATPEAIAAVVASTQPAAGFVAVRVNTINISHLIRWARKSAARHGIDLVSVPFMPAPNSDAFIELFAPFTEIRNQAIVTVRDRKHRETVIRKAGERVRAAAEMLQ